MSKRAFKVPWDFSVDLSDKRAFGRRCSQGGMAGKPKICFSNPKHNTVTLREAGKMGRSTDHGHTLLSRPQLVSSNNEAGNQMTKEVPALRAASVECDIRGSNPQNHEGH